MSVFEISSVDSATFNLMNKMLLKPNLNLTRRMQKREYLVNRQCRCTAVEKKTITFSRFY